MLPKELRIKYKRLINKRDYFNKKFIFDAYVLAEGNISIMAEGLKLTRPTLYKYIREMFGWNFKPKIESFRINPSRDKEWI